MELRKATMTGVAIGSLLGGYAPSVLWGASIFSFSSVFFSAIGGIVGIWLGFRYARSTD